MKILFNFNILKIGLIFCVFFLVSCGEIKKEDFVMIEKEILMLEVVF